jgi:hypothetical protein
VVWGEVIEYEYDIPEVELTEVEEYDIDEVETHDKKYDDIGEAPEDRETKRKGSKVQSYAAAAAALVGMGAAADHMTNRGELIDEDDVVAIAAIVNTGAVTSQLAAGTGGSGTAVTSSATATTAAASGGGVATGNTFGSAMGVGAASAQ